MFRVLVYVYQESCLHVNFLQVVEQQELRCSRTDVGRSYPVSLTSFFLVSHDRSKEYL